MTETRRINRDDIWPFRFARDNRFAGNGLVRVTGQGSCESVRGRRYDDTRPTKVKSSLDLELETKITIPNALPSIEPGAVPTCIAASAVYHSPQESRGLGELLSASNSSSVSHRSAKLPAL